MTKPIADISPRLQRMRLKCLYYDFQLVYKPGRELVIADTLSRAQLAEQYITDNHEVEQVSELTELIIPTELQRQNIKALTKSDVTLQHWSQCYRQSGQPAESYVLTLSNRSGTRNIISLSMMD